MILVRDLRLKPDEKNTVLTERAAKKLRISTSMIAGTRLVKRSLDARKKDDIHYTCALAVSVKDDEEKIVRRLGRADVSIYSEPVYEIPRLESTERPVVVGFGPAGMFAALVLSYAGLKPIVLERGQPVRERTAAVELFRRTGRLDANSNVQFGEGGAGTFSDGKLNTGTHDRRLHWMLRQFYLHGAKESVLYDAKAHVGTDVLVKVVESIREDVKAHGGEIRFSTRFEHALAENGVLTGIEYSDGEGRHVLPCRHVIIAIGHSARDTFENIHADGIKMEPKGFSMGVRIEHLQADIDLAQYGRARRSLPPADYSLNVRLPDGSGVYTFCMCPGGYVFAAASEVGGVVTNGMSYSGRGGENANAALLVTLRPEDFPDRSTLGGMYWQREIERRAYEYGGCGYRAPAQLAGDFLRDVPSTGPGRVKPMYAPGVMWGDIRQVLPERITSALAQALPELGKKLRGFDDSDAVLTAPETRSSSPVRILRGDDLQSSLRGLYPCGEGAGYAGGISSAAVDGMRCAEKLIEDMTADMKSAE